MTSKPNNTAQELRYYVASRAAHPGYCVVDRETGLAVIDGLTREQAEIEAAWRNERA